MAWFAVALVLAVSQGSKVAVAQGPGPDTSRDFVLTEKNAIMMAPPDVVCGPTVQSMKWSSDGKLLAVVRLAMDFDSKMIQAMLNEGKGGGEPPRAQYELLIWNSVARTTRRMYTVPVQEGVVAGFDWLPGSTSLFAHVKAFGEKKEDQILLMTPTTSAVPAFSFPSTHYLEYEVSPTRPVAGFAIFKDGSVQTQGQLRFLTPSGPAQELVLPKMTAFLSWGGDGSKAYVRSVYKGQISGSDLPEGWYEVNRQALRYEKSAAAPTEVQVATKQNLAAIPLSIEVFKGEPGTAKAPIVALAAGGDAKDRKASSIGVVSSDGYAAVMAPDESAIAYVSQGLGLVRRLIPIPKDAFLAARNAAAKAEIISKSKQIGLALVMFSADMDDSFPENSGWGDKVMPYIGDRKMLDGFNYTFAGGAVTDPSKTMLGFMSGPGGRAVVYADGHVVWVSD